MRARRESPAKGAILRPCASSVRRAAVGTVSNEGLASLTYQRGRVIASIRAPKGGLHGILPNNPREARPGSAAGAPFRPATNRSPTSPHAAPVVPPPPSPVAIVDVVAQLEQRATANSQQLNWRTSIVDLLKLLEIDSSLATRKELATELGCPAELIGTCQRE